MSFTPPAEFDDYVLLQPLGSGKMGHVYLAEDTVLARNVAVKFIAGVDPDLTARQRFLTEARAAARVQHPNVVTVYRVGELGDHPYIITEFVRGKSLADTAKPMPWARALAIGIDLARGLAAAHRKGVVHCDIKSANVMVTDEGVAKLVDFGLATLVQDGVSPDENHSSISGTPDFMSPEVWAGKAPTRRSDIYSVGGVLYELVAGRTPFAAVPDAELGRAVAERDAPPLVEAAQGIDARLGAIVDRCLRRDPDERFAAGDELREALEELERSASGAAVPAGNPYRGLRAFEADQRGLFFGRSAEIGALLDRLRTETFVLVTGDSGVGKSSICRAGVLPAVADGALGGGRVYTVATMVPGRRPLQALAAAVGDPELARFVDDPTGLARAIHRGLAPGAGLLLFIDQLEELVTLADPEEAQAVEEALASLAEGVPGVRVVATLRADFLARFAALPRLGQDLSRVLYFLRPLPPERIREVIVGPALAMGTRFESEAMIEALVDATAQAEGGLPLLQFALAELWEARDSGRGVIPAAALAAMGGVAGALAGHADSVLAGLPPAQRAAARRVLIRLVTAAGTRSRRGDAELGAADPAVRSALDALVRGRLLVAHDSEDGSGYELAHEVLVQGWGTLRRWLAEDAQGRAQRERVAAAAKEWEQLGRPSDALWSARRLAETEALDELAPAEQAFLTASRRAERRRRWRVRGSVSGVLVLVLGVYVGLRLQTRAQTNREVNLVLSEARTRLDRARTGAAAADARKRAAYTQFDAHARVEGEAAWADALAADRIADGAYGEASRELEAALAKDAEREDVRALLGDVLYERAVRAEADRRVDVRDELVSRFALYDGDGSRQRRWNAPAELSVNSRPPATVTLDPGGAAGPTPRKLALPRGAHVLVFRAPGRAEVRYPVYVQRGERLAVTVDLPDASRVPAGFVVAAAGRFLFGAAGDEASRRGFFDTVPLHEVDSHPYLIGRTEVTYAEWMAFVDSLPLAERAKRTPGVATKVGFAGALRVDPSPRGWRITLQPVDRAYSASWGEPIHYLGRRDHETQDWRRLPVTGISADDAEAYAEWLGATGRVPGARLCSELEWERAARGADDRVYPHGG